MSSNLKRILNKYSQKRDLALVHKNKRIQKVYDKIPRIKEIDNEISKTGLLIARSLLANPDSYESKVAETKNAMDKLKQEKAYLLAENNIDIDFLNTQYDCVHCKDTGYLEGNTKCSCLQQRLIKSAYKMSNLDEVLIRENFQTFNIDVFSTEPFENEKLSPRENMLDILSIAEGFCLNFDKQNGENLLFYGGTGLGKTFLCSCIAKHLLDSDKSVIYQTAFKIMEIVEIYRFNKKDPYGLNREQYNLLFETDLLIIDDLGTEFSNTFTTTEFFNILNSRLLSNKKTVFSTNLSPSEISNMYTDRFFSRILAHFHIIKFFGPDLRWK